MDAEVPESAAWWRRSVRHRRPAPTRSPRGLRHSGVEPGPQERRLHLVEEVRVLELGRRDVDRHGRASELPLLLPLPALVGGLLEHPSADRHDLAALLEQRDELDGCHRAELGMDPAEQGLHPDDLTAQTEQRLVVDGRAARARGPPAASWASWLRRRLSRADCPRRMPRSGPDHPAWPGTWRRPPGPG